MLKVVYKEIHKLNKIKLPMLTERKILSTFITIFSRKLNFLHVDRDYVPKRQNQELKKNNPNDLSQLNKICFAKFVKYEFIRRDTVSILMKHSVQLRINRYELENLKLTRFIQFLYNNFFFFYYKKFNDFFIFIK